MEQKLLLTTISELDLLISRIRTTQRDLEQVQKGLLRFPELNKEYTISLALITENIKVSKQHLSRILSEIKLLTEQRQTQESKTILDDFKDI